MSTFSWLSINNVATEFCLQWYKRPVQYSLILIHIYISDSYSSKNWKTRDLQKYKAVHSSEIRGLCLMKCPSKTLQNLLYFIHTKTQSCFFHFSFRATLFFPLMNALCLCRNRPRHSLGEKIKLHEMKKATLGFRMYKIWQILKRFATRAFHQA